MTHQYDDIIDKVHHQSKTRKHMSLNDRAAQFLPFAALTGYDEAINETARLTVDKKVLGPEDKALLNKRLAVVKSTIKEKPTILITYFVKDEKKDGGVYKTTETIVQSIDEARKVLMLPNREEIRITDIYKIDGEIFKDEI